MGSEPVVHIQYTYLVYGTRKYMYLGTWYAVVLRMNTTKLCTRWYLYLVIH